MKKYTIEELKENLHSNMVRFIIIIPHGKKRGKKVIYIPIWLDLL